MKLMKVAKRIVVALKRSRCDRLIIDEDSLSFQDGLERRLPLPAVSSCSIRF
jgi:hypothetical protein